MMKNFIFCFDPETWKNRFFSRWSKESQLIEDSNG